MSGGGDFHQLCLSHYFSVLLNDFMLLFPFAFALPLSNPVMSILIMLKLLHVSWEELGA